MKYSLLLWRTTKKLHVLLFILRHVCAQSHSSYCLERNAQCLEDGKGLESKLLPI